MIFFDSTKVIYSILTCYTVNYMLILYLEYIIKNRKNDIKFKNIIYSAQKVNLICS